MARKKEKNKTSTIFQNIKDYIEGNKSLKMSLIVLFLFATIGLSYAYISSNEANSGIFEGSVTMETPSGGNTLVFSENNNIRTTLTSDIYYTNGNNIVREINPTVTIQPSAPGSSENYVVAIEINKNNLKRPSNSANVILSVYDDNNNLINYGGYNGLSYTTRDGISGFDVSHATGLYNILSNETITAPTRENYTKTYRFVLTFFNDGETDIMQNQDAVFDMDVLFNTEQFKISTFTNGQALNQKMKILANNNTSMSVLDEDQVIVGYQRSNTLDVDLNDTSSYYDVSDIGDGSIIMWIDENNIVKWYSESDRVYYNMNSNQIFLKMFALNPSLLDFSGASFIRAQSLTSFFENAAHDQSTISLTLNNFATDRVISTYCMFNSFGTNATNIQIDLGDNFDARNIGSMQSMFGQVGRNSNYDIDYTNSTISLDLGDNFDARNVTDANGAFANFGLEFKNVSFNFGNKFKLYFLTNANEMFYQVGANASSLTFPLTTLNLPYLTQAQSMFLNFGMNLDSINMTLDYSMPSLIKASNMFENFGKNASNFSLTFGDNFDLKKVDEAISMFEGVGSGSYGNVNGTFNLNLGANFNISTDITLREGYLTNFSHMFEDVGRYKTSVVLNFGNNFSGKNIQQASYMFQYLGEEATSVTINKGNNFNFRELAETNYMFAYFAKNSTNMSLDLGNNFYMENVFSAYDMFYNIGSNSTTWSLNLGTNFDTSNVINMAYMFYAAGMQAIDFSLILPEKFTGDSVESAYSMFYNAGANSDTFYLEFLGEFNGQNIKTGDYMFSYPTTLSNATRTSYELHLGPNFNISSNIDLDGHQNFTGMFLQAGRYAQTVVFDLGDNFGGGKIKNMSSFFSYVGQKATSFTINLGNINTSSALTMDKMFYYVGSSATNFALNLGNNFNTSNVTDMNAMFQYVGTSSATWSLTLGDNFNTANVQNFSSMFASAAYSTTGNFSLTLPDAFVANSATDMSSMFVNVGASATSFYLKFPDNFNAANVTKANSMFAMPSTNTNANTTRTSYQLLLGNNFNLSTNVSDTTNTTAESMFAYAGRFNSSFILDLGANFGGSKIKNWSKAFQYIGTNASTWSFSPGNNFNPINATDVSSMFQYAGYTANNFNVVFNSNFTLPEATNLASMFRYAGQFSGNFHLEFSGLNIRKATSVNYMFAATSGTSSSSQAPLNPKTISGTSPSGTYELILGDNFNLGVDATATTATYFMQYAGRFFSRGTIDLGANFGGNKVTSYNYAFAYTAVGSTTVKSATNDDAFNFKMGAGFRTDSATTVSNMFTQTLRYREKGVIDLGENWNFSSATTYTSFFQYAFNKNTTGAVLDLSATDFAVSSFANTVWTGFKTSNNTIYAKDATAKSVLETSTQLTGKVSIKT